MTNFLSVLKIHKIFNFKIFTKNSKKTKNLFMNQKCLYQVYVVVLSIRLYYNTLTIQT